MSIPPIGTSSMPASSDQGQKSSSQFHPLTVIFQDSQQAASSTPSSASSPNSSEMDQFTNSGYVASPSPSPSPTSPDSASKIDKTQMNWKGRSISQPEPAEKGTSPYAIRRSLKDLRSRPTTPSSPSSHHVQSAPTGAKLVDSEGRSSGLNPLRAKSVLGLSSRAALSEADLSNVQIRSAAASSGAFPAQSQPQSPQSALKRSATLESLASGTTPNTEGKVDQDKHATPFLPELPSHLRS
jgi:hypothetical protein